MVTTITRMNQEMVTDHWSVVMVDESSVVDKHTNFGLIIKMIIAVKDKIVFAGRQAYRQTHRQTGNSQAGREGDCP